MKINTKDLEITEITLCKLLSISTDTVTTAIIQSVIDMIREAGKLAQKPNSKEVI